MKIYQTIYPLALHYSHGLEDIVYIYIYIYILFYLYKVILCLGKNPKLETI